MFEKSVFFSFNLANFFYYIENSKITKNIFFSIQVLSPHVKNSLLWNNWRRAVFGNLNFSTFSFFPPHNRLKSKIPKSSKKVFQYLSLFLMWNFENLKFSKLKRLSTFLPLKMENSKFVGNCFLVYKSVYTEYTVSFCLAPLNRKFPNYRKWFFRINI